MKKESLKMDGWMKDVAPSDELRHWFGHDPVKWTEFRRRYSAELKDHSDVLQPLLTEAQHGTVTLLYSAHDEEHNNAVALKALLEERLEQGRTGGNRGSANSTQSLKIALAPEQRRSRPV